MTRRQAAEYLVAALLMTAAAWMMAAALGAAPLQAASAQQPATAERQLEAAIHREQVLGDVKGAIEQYKTLALGANRPVAAQALARLGQCYEKLGDAQLKDARATYERIVREFGDQAEPAKLAQARLAALARPANGSAMSMRRVPGGSDWDFLGSISADGRYMSGRDYKDAGNVVVRDLVTGTSRTVGRNTDPNQWPWRSELSPDGRQVAYVWLRKGTFTEFRLAATDGSGERVLFRSNEVSGIGAMAYTPDGTRIIAMLFRGADASAVEIASIAVSDGAIRVLKKLEKRADNVSTSLAVSPDGRYIVYDYPQADTSWKHDLFLLAADGSREVPLAPHAANDLVLGWTPDGAGVVFLTERSGGQQIWLARLQNGAPAGPPEMLATAPGDIAGLGITRTGALIYGTSTLGEDAYTATLDPAASRLTGAPVRVTERYLGTNRFPTFSPDGHSLVYVSKRLVAPTWRIMYVRNLATGEEREFPSVAPDAEFLWDSQWSPDSRAILVGGIDKSGKQGLFLIDAQTAATRPLLPEVAGMYMSARWTPDGQSLIVVRRTAADSRVVRRELASGRESDIYRIPKEDMVDSLAVSPDGAAVAFSAAREGEKEFEWIGIMPAQGGEARELLRLNAGESIQGGGLVWTPDGRYLLFTKSVKNAKETRTLELWRLSPQDKAVQKIGTLASDVALTDWVALSIHPDGRRIAFYCGRESSELWVMENFLPPQKVTK